MCSTLKLIDPGENKANGEVDSSKDMVTIIVVCEDELCIEARTRLILFIFLYIYIYAKVCVV